MSDTLRYAGAALTLFVGAIHLQQYLDVLRDVPTIGELFLLNAAGAGVLAALLVTRLQVPAALGAIGLSLGSLVSILISRTEGGLFDYVEPTFRTPVALAVIAEVAAVAVLAAFLVLERRRAAQGRPSPGIA